MSAETEQTLREAIIAHARDLRGEIGDPGALLCDWIVCAQWVLAEDAGSDGYSRYTPIGQAYHRSMGLLQNAMNDYVYVNLRADDDAP